MLCGVKQEATPISEGLCYNELMMSADVGSVSELRKGGAVKSMVVQS